nr:unnamed protein product [Digitaria exilis]
MDFKKWPIWKGTEEGAVELADGEAEARVGEAVVGEAAAAAAGERAADAVRAAAAGGFEVLEGERVDGAGGRCADAGRHNRRSIERGGNPRRGLRNSPIRRRGEGDGAQSTNQMPRPERWIDRGRWGTRGFLSSCFVREAEATTNWDSGNGVGFVRSGSSPSRRAAAVVFPRREEEVEEEAGDLGGSERVAVARWRRP